MSVMLANCICCGFRLLAEESKYYSGSCEACAAQRNEDVERWRHGEQAAPGIRGLVEALGKPEAKGCLQ